jgi:origin recognition complex subunit 4
VLGEGRGGAYRVDVRLEEIGEAEGVEMGGLMGRWCREI